MEKVLSLREQSVELLKKYHVDKILFFLAFMVYIVGHFLSGTMYIYILDKSLPYTIWMVACMLALLKIFLVNVYSDWRDLCLIVSIGLIVWASSLNTNTWDMIYYYVMIVAAQDINFKSIVKVFLATVVTMLVFTIVSAKLGVIAGVTNMRLGSSDLRYALGTVYPTDLAARLFYIELFYIALRKFKLNLPEYITCLSLAAFTYIVTDTKLDVLLMLLLILAVYFKDAIILVLEKIQNLGVTLILGSMVAMIVILTYGYNSKMWILNKINNILSGRLSVGHIAFENFNVPFFGQIIEQTGNGGLHHGVYSYFFIDCSYIRVLMMNGLFSFLILVAFLVILSNKFLNEKAYSLEIALLFVALSSIIDQHLLEISYNCLLLAMFADISYFKNELE